MMNQEVRKIMNANPDIASPDQNVEELSHQMLNNGIQQMPVVEDGKLLGMVTTYDLWKNYEKKTTLGDLKVRDVMNDKVIKITPKDKVGTAAELSERSHISLSERSRRQRHQKLNSSARSHGLYLLRSIENVILLSMFLLSISYISEILFEAINGK